MLFTDLLLKHNNLKQDTPVTPTSQMETREMEVHTPPLLQQQSKDFPPLNPASDDRTASSTASYRWTGSSVDTDAMKASIPTSAASNTTLSAFNPSIVPRFRAPELCISFHFFGKCDREAVGKDCPYQHEAPKTSPLITLDSETTSTETATPSLSAAQTTIPTSDESGRNRSKKKKKKKRQLDPTSPESLTKHIKERASNHPQPNPKSLTISTSIPTQVNTFRPTSVGKNQVCL